ncbi:MAG: AtpZ/AtpI family protein [Planctomycetaceae bacterium]|jgi:hypothetical protein|nr:AtpZ/AtpI family protein [Planctomycetaceae bacterium]
MRGSRFFSSVDASLLGLGTQMLSEVVAGVLLGLGLDHILGTKGRWVVVGSIAGVAVAMVTVFRLALRPQTPRRTAPGSRAGGSAGAPSDGRGESAAPSATADGAEVTPPAADHTPRKPDEEQRA